MSEFKLAPKRQVKFLTDTNTDWFWSTLQRFWLVYVGFLLVLWWVSGRFWLVPGGFWFALVGSHFITYKFKSLTFVLQKSLPCKSLTWRLTWAWKFCYIHSWLIFNFKQLIHVWENASCTFQKKEVYFIVLLTTLNKVWLKLIGIRKCF